jgi:formate dehydrogenase maturation protein FdhE
LLFDYRQILSEVHRVLEQENIIVSPNGRAHSLKEISESETTAHLILILEQMQHFKPKVANKMIQELMTYKVPDSVSEVLAQCLAKLKLYEDDEVEEILQKLLEQRSE